MRFEQTQLANTREWKNKNKNNSKTKNTLHLFWGKTQNEIGKETQTCPQGTILAGQKINGNSIHTYIHTYFIGSSPRGFSESIYITKL